MSVIIGALVCSICEEACDQPIKNAVFLCHHCGGIAGAVPKTITIINDDGSRWVDLTTEHIVYNAR